MEVAKILQEGKDHNGQNACQANVALALFLCCDLFALCLEAGGLLASGPGLVVHLLLVGFHHLDHAFPVKGAEDLILCAQTMHALCALQAVGTTADT